MNRSTAFIETQEIKFPTTGSTTALTIIFNIPTGSTTAFITLLFINSTLCTLFLKSKF